MNGNNRPVSPTANRTFIRLDVIFSISFIVLVFLFSGIIGYLTYRNGLKTVDTLAADIFSQTSLRVDRELQGFMIIPQSINGMNRTVVARDYITPADTRQMGRLFLDEMLQFPTVKSVEFATEQNTDVSVARNVFNTPLVLGFSGTETGFAYTAFETDANGTLGKNVWTLPGFIPKDNSWYATAVKEDRQTWTPIYVWPNGDLGIDAVTPVKKNGTLIGVLDTAVTLDNITDFLKNVKKTPNYQMYIIDSEGFVVGGTNIDAPYISKTGADNKPELQRMSVADVKYPLLEQAINRLQRQFGQLRNIRQESRLNFSFNEATYYSMVLPFRDPFGLTWTIVSVAPQSDFTYQLNQSNITTILLIMLSIAIATIVASVLSRIITAPLSKLIESVKQFPNREFSLQPVTSNISEINILTDAFSDMAETVRNTIASLKTSEDIAVGKQGQYRAEKEKLEAIIQSIGDGVIVTDKYFQIQVVNRVALNLAGYELQECLGRGYDLIFKFVYEDNQSVQNDFFIKEAVRTGTVQKMSGNTLLVTKQGKHIPIEDSAAPLVDSEGKLIGCVIVFREVTRS